LLSALFPSPEALPGKTSGINGTLRRVENPTLVPLWIPDLKVTGNLQSRSPEFHQPRNGNKAETFQNATSIHPIGHFKKLERHWIAEGVVSF
jgi:hypothetical protein